MALSVFKITVIQHWLHNCWIDPEGRPCDKDTPGARFVKARKVKAGTPGARKVKKKSGKWYGRVPGSRQPVPLSANKVAAQQLLAERIRKAELGRAGIIDPFEEHPKRPLSQHVAEFESWLLAKGGGVKHARNATTRVRRIIAGCGFNLIGDLSLSRVQEFLAGLRESGRTLPPLDPGKEWYTKAELAAAV